MTPTNAERRTLTAAARTIAVLSALGALAAAVGGCVKGGGAATPKSSGARLETKDFVARDASEAASISTPQHAAQPERIGPVQASAGVDDVRVIVGAPGSGPASASANRSSTGDEAASGNQTGAANGAESARPATTVFVDAMVGQINGRPVYASEFLRPIDSRLRAESRTMSRAEWLRSAQAQIRSALFEKLRDEILLAEFETSLSPVQRRGVIAFMEDLRSTLISENFGSEELASRRLTEEEGLTVDEKVRIMRDRELIRAQVRKALGDRVYVSWREVVQQFEREAERAAPPGRASLRMIQVPTRDAARVERVRGALESGEPFADVAARESAFNPTGGGLYEISISAPTYEEGVIFRDATLNNAARALSVGQTSEPFVWTDNTVWLRLESYERPRARSLYQEQLMIQNDLRQRRLNEEERRYFTQLLQRASVTDINQMERRLVEIAAQRHLGASAN